MKFSRFFRDMTSAASLGGAAGLSFLLLVTAVPPALAQAGTTVYRCPGNPVLYTDQLSAKDAQAKGCRTIEGAPITVMQTPKPRTAAATPGNGASGDPNNRVSTSDQRSRDTERRSILENELRDAQNRLADLQKEFNGGEPERRGDEKNYAKYQERVADLKANIARKQDDIVAIKREISKLPQ